jgi:hypothetical protein
MITDFNPLIKFNIITIKIRIQIITIWNCLWFHITTENKNGFTIRIKTDLMTGSWTGTTLAMISCIRGKKKMSFLLFLLFFFFK